MITFTKPYFPRTWDKDLKQWVIRDTEQKHFGSGWVQTYDNGIAATSVMPYLVFDGYWFPLFGSAHFVSGHVNKMQQPDGQSGAVGIDDTQLSVLGYKYPRRLPTASSPTTAGVWNPGSTARRRWTRGRSPSRYRDLVLLVRFQPEAPLSPHAGHAAFHTLAPCAWIQAVRVGCR